MAKLVILTAEQLKALDQLERQAARRATREQPLTHLILQTFLQRGGPIAVEDIARIAGGPPEGTYEALAALDDQDLIRIGAGQIDMAYPFSAVPTPFRVRIPGGQERFACCATDALGMAPMIGQSIEIRSQCYHCGAPVQLSAGPDGPAPDADGVMVWFGKRGDQSCKAVDTL
jgi:hypothetical protein